jgi:hypothetical protein
MFLFLFLFLFLLFQFVPLSSNPARIYRCPCIHVHVHSNAIAMIISMIFSSFEYDCDCRYLSSARARGRAVTGVIVFLAMTLELCPAVLVMILVAVAVGRVGGLILRVEGADRVCITVAAVGHDFPGSVIVCGMECCMMFTFTAAAPSTTGRRIRRKGTQTVHGGRHGGGRLVALFVMISITSITLAVAAAQETVEARASR